MALGNNLKRIKKDSLIPAKKGKTTEVKAKTAKPKIKKPVKTKEKSTSKSKIKPATKPKVTPKPVVESKKADTDKKVSKKEIVAKQSPASKPKEIANLDEKVLLGGEEGAPLTVKLIPSRRKTVRKTKLIFEGSLSLIEAVVIKDFLLTTFNDYDVIDIQLLNITHLDIIPIQLIKVFIGFYPDKKVKVDSELPFDMKIIIDRAGFGSLMFKEEAA